MLAVRGGFCNNSQLGRFILDLPQGKRVNETSFWSARVAFSSGNQQPAGEDADVQASSFWDNPDGNPNPPDEDSEYTTPWRRNAVQARSLAARQDDGGLNPSPTAILTYKEPIQYLVRKTGYYCVGAQSPLRLPRPTLMVVRHSHCPCHRPPERPKRLHKRAPTSIHRRSFPSSIFRHRSFPKQIQWQTRSCRVPEGQRKLSSKHRRCAPAHAPD